MPPMIDIFFNDLSENLIQCVFYEILGCVLLLVDNCAVNAQAELSHTAAEGIMVWTCWRDGPNGVANPHADAVGPAEQSCADTPHRSDNGHLRG
jgi:hypothetical protein